MNENFDPRTFTSNIEFTGIQVVDDVIATLLFFAIIIMIAEGIHSWQLLEFGKFCRKWTCIILAVATVTFLLGMVL